MRYAASHQLMLIAAAAAHLLCAGAEADGQITSPLDAPGDGARRPACPLPVLSPRYLTDTCCGGMLWPGRAHQPCCGSTAYDPAVDGCCEEVLAPGFGRLPRYSCCGRSAYIPTRSSCCGGRLHDLRTYGCCAGVPYLLSAYICCDCSKLTSRRGLGVRPACCGTRAYDSTTHLCCGGSLRDVRGLSGAACCDSQLTYVGSNVRCCRGVPYNSGGPFSPFCCPDGTIDYCCADPNNNNVTYCV